MAAAQVFINPFKTKFEKKPILVAPELVFIDEEAESDNTEPEAEAANPMDTSRPSSAVGPLDEGRTQNGVGSSDDTVSLPKLDSGPIVEADKPESSNKSTSGETIAAVEPAKRVKLDIPPKNPAMDGKFSTKDRIPPRIRRASTSIFSHSTTEAPQLKSPMHSPSQSPQPQPRSNRLFSMPDVRAESLSPPPILRRSSTLRTGPPPPPKPLFRGLQRRPTTPAESQGTRPVQRVGSITLPSLDIKQNSRGRICRESELLLDLFNIFRDQWPDRPYAVMNQLRNSLLLSLAVFDDDYAKPPFASEHGGASSIKQVVSRFRRIREGKETIDLCLVMWEPTCMSYREQSVLQETHRYRPRYSGRSNDWQGAQKVIWYPSWEPTKNVPEGMADRFSSERDRIWKQDKELTFETMVSDGDWC
ncbi:hypothetical protein TWF225_001859 [Orbilia oligospora]|nr:hypothetical protein TWF751_011660 [Orbilia oligospora]KAF3190890.1 hypothetical protein TWF225_001859 [Orbilia oligospora]KAF3262263.1 hypothetical protein TWF217_004327 [Orbilia oligospora]KAF3265239.1 hypothetical protein TWF128_000528 [Orbilia oligospora]KAF3293791.1 hypothetical protein TWF132_004384 [Orbilia oligospora]